MREYFKDLPDTTTPLISQRINGFLNGKESIEKIVVGNIESKNLFSLNTVVIPLTDTLTMTKNKNSQIIIDGHGNASNYLITDTDNVKDTEGIILQPGKYTASLKKVSGSVSGNSITWFFRESDGTNIYDGTSKFNFAINSNTANDNVQTHTFEIEQETRLHVVGYNSDSTITFNNLILEFQIEDGETNTSFSPDKKYGYFDTGWVQLSLSNNFSEYSGDYSKFSCRRINDQVFFKGMIESSKADPQDNEAIAATLPTIFIPNKPVYALVNSNDKPINSIVRSDGSVCIYNKEASWISMDTINYFVD